MDKSLEKIVLIVDDSEFNIELVKALITVENDINFIDACDGKEDDGQQAQHRNVNVDRA